MLTNEQIDFFNANGYLVVENAVSVNNSSPCAMISPAG